MVRGFKTLILIVLGCLFLQTQTSLSQEDKNVIYVSYEVRNPKAEKIKNDLFQRIESYAKRTLDVEIIFFEVGDVNHSNPSLHLIFDWEESEMFGTTLEMRTLVSPLKQISPILYDIPAVVKDRNTGGDFTFWMITSHIAYVAGYCDEAKVAANQAAYLDHQFTLFVTPRYDAGMEAFFKSNCLILEGDYEGALEWSYVTWASTSRDLIIPVNMNMGWIYVQLGEVDQALKFVQGSENLIVANDRPELLSEFFAKRSGLYTLINDFDTALADINTALDLYYDSVDSPFNVDPAILAPLFVQRGQIHLFLYEWDKVLEDYNTALQIDPAYADPYYYRGVLYYSVRFERENAIPDFERYLELAPDGELAEKAQQYLTDIQAELEALER
jgi:hypothetical protein